MLSLPPSFLGHRVSLEGDKTNEYIIRYEDHQKLKTHVLLCKQESPEIFATLNHEGDFLESFYLSNKTTDLAAQSLDRYKSIIERKKQFRITQDDLKDALKPESKAKMKNEHIKKHLVDEHLQDIKNQWPSRLLTLQNMEGSYEDSLILTTLEDALQQANPTKSFQFLCNHRYDIFVPRIASMLPKHRDLFTTISQYYLKYNHTDTLEQLMYNMINIVDLTDDRELIESVLARAQHIDSTHFSDHLKNMMKTLFKRVKRETEHSPKEWLKFIVTDQKLKLAIISSLKEQKTG
ncbi:hypothetical protein [Texcoconibacillus texcoconensis]|uniref:Uncharacterized protein n=1 Tax=Texcoconibacillus texcoconensis TaxID=1095777 RepID=A0A840QTG6_9BACI|nr:hypothetical protein [Texcoconibacillus texcoconensis]MBB5174640.1 hypothetical protein [Texcoconibacillus texcoconensis]